MDHHFWGTEQSCYVGCEERSVGDFPIERNLMPL